jgi:hypothetical protein
MRPSTLKGSKTAVAPYCSISTAQSEPLSTLNVQLGQKPLNAPLFKYQNRFRLIRSSLNARLGSCSSLDPPYDCVVFNFPHVGLGLKDQVATPAPNCAPCDTQNNRWPPQAQRQPAPTHPHIHTPPQIPSPPNTRAHTQARAHTHTQISQSAAIYRRVALSWAALRRRDNIAASQALNKAISGVRDADVLRVVLRRRTTSR